MPSWSLAESFSLLHDIFLLQIHFVRQETLLGNSWSQFMCFWRQTVYLGVQNHNFLQSVLEICQDMYFDIPNIPLVESKCIQTVAIQICLHVLSQKSLIQDYWVLPIHTVHLLLSSDYKTLPQDGGYWLEQIPKSEAALCAAIDPAADFRWHSLNCGGPETASFICELPGMYMLVLSSVASGKI